MDFSEEFGYDRIYLNNASTSRMPRSSIRAMSEFLARYNEYGPDSELSDEHVRERLNNLRKAVSVLINCRPEEVILTQSVTDGINFVASGMRLESGSNIVTRGASHEHPANHYPWVRTGQRAELRDLQIDETGYFEQEHLRKMVDHNTKLVVLSHALFNTGAILPVEEVGKYLSERKIPYFIDAAQSVGCIADVDVSKIRCDFMSFNGSKWLCGPMGTGIFFCKKESSELVEPLAVGGESAILHDKKLVYKEMPARFQAGFRNWSGVAGLEASVNYLLKIGIEKIRAKNIKLANLMREELSKIPGVALFGPEEEARRTSIVSFAIKDQNPETLVKRLQKENIVLAVREILSRKVIRASPHFYNTESEILRVVEALKK
ncbi:MAG TPA: aminotransferase class V-fold PLP-dependent enzyme [Candidatus Nitrosotalea sp.]|nr:aminotransferase class V-fold PLP-dependent enzyme [Candidatus Nitrosotalea sp.]